MSFQERKKKILNILEEFDQLSVSEISEKTAVSPATVRRDLKDLDAQGLLQRTHGGAIKLETQKFTGFHQKKNVSESKKQFIAKLAAEHVKPGDTLFMDCGSTVFAMCSYLKKTKPLKIITNSLPIVAELMTCPEISLNLIGGELDQARRAVHGQMALEHINHYHAPKAFIGTDGFSIKKGLTSNTELEASITKAFCINADQVYLLCDASKIESNAYVQSASLSQIKYLITDIPPAVTVLNELSMKGIITLSGEIDQ
ncbi:DeoR/GlpR transcriptional regulator [Pedobacter sp. HMWF019]|uniref:DeoR/GlpR family DNA-binding transcription regulator n=1 Tax=Pedobacter sp. HMWF019 TaxID=2056856 RepID=UPI000D3844B0|nr:DeoR/GlpR family DNA-binding transcription regulator [Pedobacter sp. HMWF019]PTT00155.1 DeoR/GlpR transcriptional regulator [Pedobacter sp. HMWF019]